MQLRLGNLTYTLKAMSESEADRLVAEGFHDARTQTIEVDPRLPPDRQGETLLHELLHAGWLACDLDDRTPEEKAVTLLARFLASAFRDNGTLSVLLNATLVEGRRVFHPSN